MRRAYITITPEFLAEICKPSKPRIVSVDSVVPEDAKFITSEYNPLRDCYRVLFEHDSFDVVPEGNTAPRLESPIIHTEELDADYYR